MKNSRIRFKITQYCYYVLYILMVIIVINNIIRKKLIGEDCDTEIIICYWHLTAECGRAGDVVGILGCHKPRVLPSEPPSSSYEDYHIISAILHHKNFLNQE